MIRQRNRDYANKSVNSYKKFSNLSLNSIDNSDKIADQLRVLRVYLSEISF